MPEPDWRRDGRSIWSESDDSGDDDAPLPPDRDNMYGHAWAAAGVFICEHTATIRFVCAYVFPPIWIDLFYSDAAGSNVLGGFLAVFSAYAWHYLAWRDRRRPGLRGWVADEVYHAPVFIERCAIRLEKRATRVAQCNPLPFILVLYVFLEVLFVPYADRFAFIRALLFLLAKDDPATGCTIDNASATHCKCAQS